MASSFPDHFSSTADGYASYRPSYPAPLFEWLSRNAADREVAWDCGTGNGQAAVALAEHFTLVVASDPSTAQLAHSALHPRVHYAAMTAESSALANGSVSLVTVAQALHWFNRPAFFAEARRVLVPRGILAAWSYGVVTLKDHALDRIVRQFHGDDLGPFWPPERSLVDEGYRGVTLPFEQIVAPRFTMDAQWTLRQFAGYLSTWSAVQRARAATGADPIPRVVESLRPGWGPEGATRGVEWPLALLVGRA